MVNIISSHTVKPLDQKKSLNCKNLTKTHNFNQNNKNYLKNEAGGEPSDVLFRFTLRDVLADDCRIETEL